METFTCNLSVGKARREVVNGEAYLVAPMTLIVPGVLPGSDGPLYYPPDETRRSARDWNGTPITVYHPFRDGRNVSASDPGVLESQGVGFLKRSTFNGSKLRAEGWFHVEDTRRVDPRVLESLEAGRPLELSTGLFVDKEPALNGAACPKGRPYHSVARNYKPDHLAVLPDQVGACSIQDGCGVLVNQKGSALWDFIQSTGGVVASLNRVASDGWTTVENEPSDELDMDPEKACQILRDGMVHGKELTEAQRGMFGALCGQRKKTENAWAPVESYQWTNASSSTSQVLTANACCQRCERGECCEATDNEGTSLSKDSWVAEEEDGERRTTKNLWDKEQDDGSEDWEPIT